MGILVKNELSLIFFSEIEMPRVTNEFLKWCATISKFNMN